MSRKYCQNWKKWINNVPYCSYYRNTLCDNVEECPAHYDDEEDNIGKAYYDGEGEDEDEVVLQIKYKGIIVELKNVVEVAENSRTRKVILVTLDNGINLKSDYEVEFFKKLQEVKQSKRMIKVTANADTNMIECISYPDN
jgi:hypothetical protein